MLGAVIILASSVSAANFGPIGPDYALCTHDGGGSDWVCTYEVKYDDSTYASMDDEEEIQARWDEEIPMNAIIEEVIVHVHGKEIDPNIKADIQLWSAYSDEELTSYQSFPYNTWTTLVFEDSRLLDEVQDRVSDGDDIKLEVDFEKDCGSDCSNAVVIDYVWLEIEYTLPECIIEINNPESGNYYNDDIYISWTTENCLSSSYDLYYREGSCSLQAPLDWDSIIYELNDGEYFWTSGFDEGEFCIKVEESGSYGIGVMDDTFFIDNIDPTADAGCEDEEYDPCELCELEMIYEDHCEDGVYVCYEGETILLDGSNSFDEGEYASGIDTWEWYIDGEYYDEGEIVEYDCLDGDMTLEVALRVTDNAGNDDTDYSEIEVMNVDPICEGILAPSDVAVGQPVDFMGSAYDVEADIPLSFTWEFGDESSLEGESVTHTYTTAGEYTVLLTVEDKDGGYDTCEHYLDVVEPTPLMNQEVAAYYPLDADFGEDAGSAGNSFMTTLEDLEECMFVVSPDNMVTWDTNGDSCVVKWDMSETANPTNDERGEHTVIVRVENEEGDYEYYSFYVTVYSWMIDLYEGWNLISIPLVPEEDNSIENVIINPIYDSLPEGTEYVIFSYQPNCCDECGDIGSWLKSRRTGYGDLDTVMPGYGYWVKVTEDTVLKGFGTQVGQTQMLPGMPPSVDVPANNWALIGRYGILGLPWNPGESEDNKVHGQLHKDKALMSVKKLDNDLHVYTVDDLGHLGIVDYLYNNQGYWLWVEDHAFSNVKCESYAPIDEYYPEN